MCNHDALSELFDQLFDRRRSMVPTSLPGSDLAKESKHFIELMELMAVYDRDSLSRFKDDLSQRTGYGEQIYLWLKGTPPNAMVRSIILAGAEDLAKLYQFALGVVPLKIAA
jgi:hypothetical protein